MKKLERSELQQISKERETPLNVIGPRLVFFSKFCFGHLTDFS